MDIDVKMQINENGKILKDIDGIQLFNEIISLKKEIFSNKKTPTDILEYILKNELTPCFSSFALAIRIGLTLPISVASEERSFSKLKIIKNYLRSSFSQERLSDLAIIYIESDISETLDLIAVIDELASKKVRKSLI